MTQTPLVVANVVAITLLVFAIYFPRHRHRDMVVAYLGINAGVLAVTTVLASVDASLGLGIGLFGVLSIIRLRSDELDQRQVAYYFASLALGLLGGAPIEDDRLAIALMAGLLLVLWLGDHPRLLGRYRAHALTLDRAFTDERELRAHLTTLLGGRMRSVSIRRVDFVNDTTTVDVRYELASGEAAAVEHAPTSVLSTAPLR